MSFVVLIPTRLNSIRLPNKPLINIKGKSLIQRVYERAILSSAEEVYIITDNNETSNLCRSINAPCIMTSDSHKTGTDRLAEASKILKFNDDQIIVNLQGDEPFALPEDINNVADILLNNKDADMGTLYVKINNFSDIQNTNKVKIWVGRNSQVYRFSRDHKYNHAHKMQLGIHIGIYSYKASFLREYVLMERSKNEKLENLEQLRVMDNGSNIYARLSHNKHHLGIDTAEDLKKAERLISRYGL